MSSIKQILRRVLRTPVDVDLKSHLKFITWQKILRVNSNADWPVHITSRVVEPQNVTLGKGSYPGDMPGCYIQALNGIEIGDYCLFGPNCGLISANHDLQNFNLHMKAPPIKIGHRCWIGMGAIILPGVVLGDYTVVGANSVVTKSFPEGSCVLGGNPARVIKVLPASPFPTT